jgi:hypothetical protein
MFLIDLIIAQIRCPCGLQVNALTDEPPATRETSRQVIRYQGHCVCGRIFLISMASTHGQQAWGNL